MDEKLVLLISIVGSSIRDVIKDFLLIEAKPLSDWHQSFWSERSLCVDVHRHASPTSILDWKLASHAKRVAKLGLTSPEFAKDPRDRACLNTRAEEAIELLAPS